MDTFASGDHTTPESTEAQEPTTALSFKVGEREYDAESASKKIEHADAFITEMKAKEAEYQAEIARLKAEQAQSLKLEDALSKLQTQQTTPVQHTTEKEVVSNVESQEDVVRRILQEREEKEKQEQQEALRQSTFTDVQKRLTDLYGADNVDKVVREKAEEIGIDFQSALNMAHDPVQSKILLRLFESGTTRTQAAPTGQINTASLNRKQEQKVSVAGMTSVEMANYMKQLRSQN